MLSADHQSRNSQLSSWKEIARYLGCDQRTARRWERQRGLPVYRPPGGKRGHVYAYTHELDRWLKRLGTERPPTHTWARLRPLRRAPVILAAFAAVVVTGLGYLRLRPVHPAQARVLGRVLEVRDSAGRLLWTYTFPDSLRASDELQGSMMDAARSVHVADLQGDGNSEVLFRAAYRSEEGPDGPDREELCCFSSRGKLLWCYRPQVSLRMGDTRFDGPWRFTDVMPVRTQKGPQLWAAIVHWQWRPSFVIRLDPSGRAALRFVNAGYIYVLDYVRNAGGDYLLAGGINNEYAAAFLAVLRPDGEPACSPQTPGSAFECTEGPSGSPERYFLFPPSELSRMLIPYNEVHQIEASLGKRVIISRETEDGLWALYQFSDKLEPESFTFNYRFGSLHRRLEHQGLLKHTFEDCPEWKRPVKIRRWDPKSSWTTVEVPPTPGVRPDVWKKKK